MRLVFVSLTALAFVACSRPLDVPIDSTPDAATGPRPSGDWRWENPLLQGNTLRGVWGAAPDDVWSVGEHGTILHFDGTTTAIVESPVKRTLVAVWGSAHDDVWAVGVGGTMLHFDGGTWARAASVTPNDLAAVWGLAHDQVWAVGANGTILRYDGTSWSTMPSGTTMPLNAIGGVADQVWIAGGAACIECAIAGTLLEGDGSTFTPVAAPPAALTGLWVRGPNDVWTTGGTGGGTPGSLAHFDGQSWTTPTFPGSDPLIPPLIGGGGPNDGWIFVENARYHFDGTTWTMVSMDGPDGVNALWMSGAGAGWAVGVGGVMLRGDGGTWTESTTSFTREPLSAAWASGSDLWVGVGQPAYSTTALLHHDAGGWHSVTLPGCVPSCTVSALWGMASDNLFVGGTQLVPDGGEPALFSHYDGTHWVAMTLSPRVSEIAGIWGPGGDSVDVWAISGSPDDILFQGNPTDPDGWAWTPHPLHLDSKWEPQAIWGSGPKDLYIAFSDPEQEGMVLHGDGTTFVTETIPFAPMGLWGSGPNDVWVVGVIDDTKAQLGHRDAHGWTFTAITPVPFMSPPIGSTGPSTSIWGSGPSDVYAALGGPIYHFDGTAWSVDADLTYNAITAIAGGGDGLVWAVGDFGTVLRRGP